MALGPAAAAGLGSILDSAVKRAVSHLASVPEPGPGSGGVDKGPSRVDFLYYEGNAPYYDYYYDSDDSSSAPVAPSDSLLSPPDGSPPPWAAHLTPRPPHWIQHRDKFPARPLGPPTGNHVRRQDRIGAAVSSLSAYLPALIILPIIAATSYYLVVLNGPTPVVKERSVAQDSSWGPVGDSAWGPVGDSSWGPVGDSAWGPLGDWALRTLATTLGAWRD
jgi:hypothetical protein